MKSEVGRPKTEAGRPKPEAGRPKSEDRSRKTEAGRPKKKKTKIKNYTEEKGEPLRITERKNRRTRKHAQVPDHFNF